MLPQVVHIGSNQSVRYKTQHGETYGRNTKCVVHFKVLILFSSENPSLRVFCSQKSRSCPSLVVSCPKFDIAHPKANCKGKGGDFLSLGKKRFEIIFTCALVFSSVSLDMTPFLLPKIAMHFLTNGIKK